ncbi:MAG TPA: hypothetical protein VF234_03300 [Limnochordia bacterium]
MTAVDPAATLFDMGTRDLWQVPVLSRSGALIGRVVRQIVEPRLYTVRYLVVFDAASGRRFLLPANTIVDVAEEGVLCNLDTREVQALPPAGPILDRPEEEALYKAIGRTPHWIEEAQTTGGAPTPPRAQSPLEGGTDADEPEGGS